jgi:hypothetical protein
MVLDLGRCLWPPCSDTTFRTYGKPKHRQYQLDFGEAHWIEPADSPAPIAYFRQEIYPLALSRNRRGSRLLPQITLADRKRTHRQVSVP